jgi:hypothetical protein
VSLLLVVRVARITRTAADAGGGSGFGNFNNGASQESRKELSVFHILFKFAPLERISLIADLTI